MQPCSLLPSAYCCMGHPSALLLCATSLCNHSLVPLYHFKSRLLSLSSSNLSKLNLHPAHCPAKRINSTSHYPCERFSARHCQGLSLAVLQHSRAGLYPQPHSLLPYAHLCFTCCLWKTRGMWSATDYPYLTVILSCQSISNHCLWL